MSDFDDLVEKQVAQRKNILDYCFKVLGRAAHPLFLKRLPFRKKGCYICPGCGRQYHPATHSLDSATNDLEREQHLSWICSDACFFKATKGKRRK